MLIEIDDSMTHTLDLSAVAGIDLADGDSHVYSCKDPLMIGPPRKTARWCNCRITRSRSGRSVWLPAEARHSRRWMHRWPP